MPEGPHRVVYEGSAMQFNLDHGGSADDEPLFDNAIKNAYEKGIANKTPRFDEEERPIPYQFRVVGIFVEGINPPTDYKVHLVDHP